jgi:hypothetical protein
MFSCAMAPAVVLALLRDEAPERHAVEHQLARDARARRERRVEVLERGVRLGGLAVVLLRSALDDVLKTLARLRVERVEELVEVDRRLGLVGSDLAAAVDLRRAVGARLELDVAVGDPRQRRRANDGGRALVQRVEAGADRHLHARLGMVVESDRLDLADRASRHLDEVALHELAGVRERRRDGVARPAAEHEERDHDDDRDESRRNYDTCN